MQKITLAMGRALQRLGVNKSRTMNMSLLMGLIGTLGLTVLLGSLIPAETSDDTSVPRWEIGSGDDKDVFRFEITETGRYAIAMTDGPPGVGIWAIWYADGTGDYVSRGAPLERVFEDL